MAPVHPATAPVQRHCGLRAASTCRAPEVVLHHTGEGQDQVREGAREGAGEAALLPSPQQGL